METEVTEVKEPKPDERQEAFLRSLDEIMSPQITTDTFTVKWQEGDKEKNKTWKIYHMVNYWSRIWRSSARLIDDQLFSTAIEFFTSVVGGGGTIYDPGKWVSDIGMTRAFSEELYPKLVAILIRSQDPQFELGEEAPEGVIGLTKWLDQHMTYADMQEVVYAVEKKLEAQKELGKLLKRKLNDMLESTLGITLTGAIRKLGITQRVLSSLDRITSVDSTKDRSFLPSTENSNATGSPTPNEPPVAA